MKKVEIFDPAMCCSTGVCGPSVDPDLTRVASAVYSLENKGFDIKRYQLTNDPDKFADNNKINRVLQEKGPDALPIVLVDGEIANVGGYPSNDELAEWFDTNPEELTEKPKVRLSINMNDLK
ncbi:arsenical resistance operon trans-acting repressor ArsD [Gracilibacillus boraciitolerans JCM 21714]|uniref:Arsenical resistance operon trans-acting repressor ArsD n=1 Tax=Gracilibacillus boraciitolerans JCM 21714 TaxID=1298598 RepID=W4VGE5_9BACI|nr:arsenite efflux transporter metallochaperone ArsD [Gracilibacillus boraciitolerans]GAE92282.1 arsenical resistance operon trans-acting repressor ArsD [Gracilibacillus boraciitolerans JCM 21714]